MTHHDDFDVEAEQLPIDAEQVLLEARLAHIAAPAGASADPWFCIRADDGDAVRSLRWSDRDAGEGVGASVTGWQHETGDVTRSVTVWLSSDTADITATTARALAAALLQAADELERIER